MIVDYYSASWCGPCKALRPKMEKLCAELGYDFVYHDIDEEGKKALEAGVMGVPTIITDRGIIRPGTTFAKIKSDLKEL